jgi:hypothetical protein
MDKLELTMLLTRWKSETCVSDMMLRTLVAILFTLSCTGVPVQLKFSIRAITVSCNPLFINRFSGFPVVRGRAAPVPFWRFFWQGRAALYSRVGRTVLLARFSRGAPRYEKLPDPAIRGVHLLR